MAYRVLTGADSIKQVILDFFAFTGAPYGWYMEMYIGLFLLIPFLNVMYNGLQTKKQKQVLLGVLFVLVSLPSMVNIWRILDWQWLRMPSSNETYHPLMPDWWTDMYPILFYCMGCYLNEYPLQISRRKNLLLIGAVFLLSGSFAYYRAWNGVFSYGPWDDYASVGNAVQAMLLFNLLAGLDLTGMNDKSKVFLSRLSGWAMGAYLVSWVFDNLFYRVLNAWRGAFLVKLRWFPVIVAAVFFCSLAASGVLNGIYHQLENGLKRLKKSAG